MEGNSTFVAANPKNRKQKSYWMEKLRAAELKDVLPRRHAGQPQEQQAAASGKAELRLVLPPHLSQKLNQLSGQSDVTLFIVLLSAFIGFLHRYTAQEQLYVAVPVYDGERQSGLLSEANELLPVGGTIEDGMGFRSLLIAMKEEFVQAMEHRDYPLAEVFEGLQLNPVQADEWLCQLVFASENVHRLERVLGNPRYQLLALCKREEERVELSFTFDRRNYDEEELRRMLPCFQVFLGAVLDDMSLGLSSARLISGEEEAVLLAEFNRTRLDYPADRTAIRLFEEQADRTPDRVAVVHREQRMTYRELNQKANRLARKLKSLGVRRETFVGLMLERGLDMVAGILGIMKAGGAYIPLDPNSPGNRIAHMISESRPLLVVTREEMAQRHSLSQALLLESLAEDDGRENCDNPEPVNEPTDLAYLLFTSGSTGAPKGSMIEHRNIVNLVAGLQERILKNYEGQCLRIALLAPFIFDMSVEQMFGSLLLGHSLYIVPEEARADGERLLEFFISERIDLSDGTPSHLVLLLEAMKHHPEGLEMKQLVIGGESLPKETVERLFSRLGPSAPIITNSYGLTECCVDSTYFDITEQNIELYHRLPIGYPLPNQEVYIVNRQHMLQPVGVVGELCIGGGNIGRGYLNRDELNAKAFVDNPFRPGQKMYKTGDLAKWLPDGNVECLGRMDTQIKIRGYRIELDEIENSLRKHPAVQDVKVLAVDPLGGDNRKAPEQSGSAKQLCAYIVVSRPVDNADLRQFLGQELPDYMIPAYFVRLDRMPLNQNDKVDRSKLPSLDLSVYTEGTEATAAPTNEQERRLAECWKEVLGRESIGIKDNFFGIGGDSIKAIQLVSRMRQQQYKLAVRDVFQFPTIAELAKKIVRTNREADQSEVTGIVPLTPIQRDFFGGCPADIHHYNQSVLLETEPELDEAAARFIFTHLQAHHDVLRITFPLEGGRRIQVNRGTDLPVSVQRFDLRGSGEAREQFRLREKELQSGIDLESGPLMRVGLFELDGVNRLLISVHHTVIDGISWRILIEDIDTLYRQYKEGKPASLPLKSDSFKQWAEQLESYARSDALAKEIPYWQESASLARSLLRIERDSPDAAYYVRDEEVLSLTLSESDTAALLYQVHHAFLTEINDILLTALGRGVWRAFGIQAVQVELEGHGREPIVPDLDSSRTVGWFTSWYPVLVDVSGGDDPAGQIKRVKETLRAVPNKGIGYGILKYLGDPQACQFSERPQICFNYLGRFDEDVNESLFSMADEALDSNESANRTRENDFIMDGAVMDGKLQVHMSYSPKQYNPATAQGLLDAFRDELLGLIAFCASRTGSEVTPSDLGFKELSMEQLDHFFD
ncbi:amino acid adenylation domain-containing protein [Paenibacillus elgii]